jgi:hypothetical protein
VAALRRGDALWVNLCAWGNFIWGTPLLCDWGDLKLRRT